MALMGLKTLWAELMVLAVAVVSPLEWPPEYRRVFR